MAFPSMFTKVLYIPSSMGADTNLNHHPQWVEVEVPLEQAAAVEEVGLEVPRVRRLRIKKRPERNSKCNFCSRKDSIPALINISCKNSARKAVQDSHETSDDNGAGDNR